MGKKVVTYEKLRKVQRDAISNSFSGPLPLDKQQLTIETGIIEKFYPDDYTAYVVLRDTINDITPVKFMVDIDIPLLMGNMEVLCIPKGDTNYCNIQNKLCIIPETTIIGDIFFRGGDINQKGAVLFSFNKTYLTHDREFNHEDMGTIIIKNKDSEIIIGETEIQINSPSVKINGVEL